MKIIENIIFTWIFCQQRRAGRIRTLSSFKTVKSLVIANNLNTAIYPIYLAIVKVHLSGDTSHYVEATLTFLKNGKSVKNGKLPHTRNGLKLEIKTFIWNSPYIKIKAESTLNIAKINNRYSISQLINIRRYVSHRSLSSFLI